MSNCSPVQSVATFLHKTKYVQWFIHWIEYIYVSVRSDWNQGHPIGFCRSLSEWGGSHSEEAKNSTPKEVNGVSACSSQKPLGLACLSAQITFSPLIIQCVELRGVETLLHAPINTKTCLRKTNAFCFLFWSSFNNVLEPPFSNVWGSAGKQDIHQNDRQNKLQSKQNLNVSPKLMVSRLLGRRPRHSHAAAVKLIRRCSSAHKTAGEKKGRGSDFWITPDF